MVVKTQSNGRQGFGLRVSATNVRRYFPRTVGAVELRLDDLQIECRLPETFWSGEPEIHDPRLCEWLKFKVMRERRDQVPIALLMERSGSNTFTLHARGLEARRSPRFDHAA